MAESYESDIVFGELDTQFSDGEVALRQWRPADIDQIVACCSDPEIPRWTLMPDPLERHHADEFVGEARQLWEHREAAHLAVTPFGDPDRVIGAVGMHVRMPEIGHVGYWVARDARGRGVATCALRLLSDWALGTTGLARLELEVIVGNEASCRVAEAAGYRREGVLRSSINQRGVRHDGILYSLLPSDLG